MDFAFKNRNPVSFKILLHSFYKMDVEKKYENMNDIVISVIDKLYQHHYKKIDCVLCKKNFKKVMNI